jgi:aryl-alcohol dehydrogenase-like predicted oxidoreductase
MKYTNLPLTDLKISKICLGTMTWGQQNTEEEGHQQMSYALDQGVNFFDTAELYSIPPRAETYGSTERIIGSWFQKTGNRHKVVLASKIAGPAPFTKHIRTSGFKEDSISNALEASLQRLKTDYIDLYQLHWPERQTNYFGQRGYKHHPQDSWSDNFEHVLAELQKLQKEGKIRYVGLSNETPWGAMRYLNLSNVNGYPRMSTIQNPYSLLNRTFESGLAEIAMREDLKLLAYSPLGFGVLSGKYLNGQKPVNSRITLFPHYDRYVKGAAVQATEQYAQVAEKYDIPMAKMALAFVNSRPFLASNIIGATTLPQLKENIDSIQVELGEDVIADIDRIHEQIPNPAP